MDCIGLSKVVQLRLKVNSSQLQKLREPPLRLWRTLGWNFTHLMNNGDVTVFNGAFPRGIWQGRRCLTNGMLCHAIPPLSSFPFPSTAPLLYSDDPVAGKARDAGQRVLHTFAAREPRGYDVWMWGLQWAQSSPTFPLSVVNAPNCLQLATLSTDAGSPDRL